MALYEVCDLVPGFAFKSENFGDYKDKVIKIGDIVPPDVDMEHLPGVDISCYNKDKLKQYLVYAGDYVLAMTGSTIGKVGRIRNGQAYINQRVLVFRPKDIVDSDYLYYVLSQPLFRQFVVNHADSETAKPNISASSTSKFSFSLPPIEIQQKIGGLLSALDKKIAINKAINKNLEATAQAIFKSWFVDFEPFGGVMPANAQITELKKLCSVVTKGTTPTTLGMSFRDYGVNFIKAESILQNHSFDVQKFSYIDNETNEILKRSMLNVGDIVFTIAGTLGRFSLVDASILPANTNQAVAIIRPDTSLISSEYLYSFFVGNWHNIYYTSRIQQAVQANLSLTTIKTLPVILLDYKEKQEYTELITPLFEKIRQNLSQNQRLAAIRDTLLPKLMSGEINVSQVKI